RSVCHWPGRTQRGSRVPHTGGLSPIPFALLLVASLSFLSLAQGAERMGDATFADSYQQHARTVATLENEILFLIEIAPDEERFNLYWTYDHLMGTWLQVELLQTQLAV